MWQGLALPGFRNMPDPANTGYFPACSIISLLWIRITSLSPDPNNGAEARRPERLYGLFTGLFDGMFPHGLRQQKMAPTPPVRSGGWGPSGSICQMDGLEKSLDQDITNLALKLSPPR